MRRLIIAGATGMIGKALCKKLEEKYELVIVSRNTKNAENILGKKYQYFSWDDPNILSKTINNSFGVINLTGQNINSGRWTGKMKTKILESRVNAGKLLSKAIMSNNIKPFVFIQCSAIGYYSHDYEKEYNESSLCFDNSFLHNVCQQWELASKEVKQYNVRHVITRIGLVMDKDDGVFPKLYLPFKYYAGGYLGNGRQWISWIHLEDVINAIIFLLEKKDSSGIYNLTNPNPIRYKYLSKIISDISQKPARLNIPGYVLKMIYGQMAKETLLASQKVMPHRLLTSGFNFTFSDIRHVIKEFLNDNDN